MNKYEKDDINNLSSKYRPLGMWAYLGYSILFFVPVIGQIAIIVMSFVGGNVNRRSFARFYLLLLIIFIILLVAAALVLYFTGYYKIVLEYIKDYLPYFGITL